jgi:hypothetical protein
VAVRTSRTKSMSREFDGYIAKAQPFAKPILTRLRTLFHRACPEITEALKWGHPAFEHCGIEWLSEGKPRHWKYMKGR